MEVGQLTITIAHDVIRLIGALCGAPPRPCALQKSPPNYVGRFVRLIVLLPISGGRVSQRPTDSLERNEKTKQQQTNEGRHEITTGRQRKREPELSMMLAPKSGSTPLILAGSNLEFVLLSPPRRRDCPIGAILLSLRGFQSHVPSSLILCLVCFLLLEIESSDARVSIIISAPDAAANSTTSKTHHRHRRRLTKIQMMGTKTMMMMRIRGSSRLASRLRLARPLLLAHCSSHAS